MFLFVYTFFILCISIRSIWRVITYCRRTAYSYYSIPRMFANFKKLFHGSSTYSTQSINNFKYKVIMNKSAFIRFGIFVTAFRCLLAFTAIVKIILAMYVKNRLISPIREWLSDVIFYSIFTPLLVLSVTVVESMDYTKKNVRSFK